MSKQESTSDYSSINLTIDEKKNKGYFGKFLGGYGTDDRYETSLILNFFKDKQKISILASANNINSTGFTQDEVFDSMGGERNANGNARASGTGRGITESSMVGLNYNDEWSKNFEASGSYKFENSVNKNESKSNQANFLPTSTFFTESNSKARSENTGNNANFELEYKINPNTRLVFTPAISQSRANSLSESSSFSKDEEEVSLNESNSKSYRESTATSFANSINFNKGFEKRARNLSFVFSNNNTANDSDGINVSKTVFYQGSKPDDERNQNSKGDNSYDSYSADIEFTEPITDSLRVRIGADFDWQNSINDAKTYDFDMASQSYSDLNDLQTNYTTSSRIPLPQKWDLVSRKTILLLI